MRSILVLLILVMIGLNGKGQSVTALPDSVLSQCCLEVTLLNGNVTTVDWVFIQYITRDGTGTKLFVEYAPNFGGIQWETQIRIQDDFDDVLERSKFIILPFTVGSTDYGIHRNWIANIEENTTTGGTWIYGRFGTPTKRKFSAVEDYETLKNLLLACRPRAIVVAENGLYTEGDTVRMGGFLIEPTTITTEGYNWMMKDTLSKTEFGIDYLTAETGDTTVYWGRRSGSVRQMMQMGNRYWYNTMKDTVGGLFSDLTHSWNSGNPFLKYLIFNPLDPNSGTVQLQIQKDNSFLIMSNETTNPYYTPGWIVTNNSVQIGVNESGSGDPGNGVLMGAFGDGTSNEYLFMVTKNVDNNIATNGQFLQLIDDTNGKVEFATIDLSAYLPIADTAAMLSKYIERGDTALMLTNYVTFGNLSGYPTGTGTADRLARWTATNTLAAGNLSDNGTKLESLLPHQLALYTTATLPTGVKRYMLWDDTKVGPAWYNGTRWAYGLESTFNRGTDTRIPFFDANGQVTDNGGITYTSSTQTLNLNGSAGGSMAIFTPNTAADGILTVNTRGQFISRRRTDEADFAAFAVINTSGDLAARLVLGLNTGTPSLAFGSGSAVRDVFVQRPIASQALVFNFTSSNIERFRFTNTAAGFFTSSPTQELDVNGDAYIRDSTRLTTTPAHTSITGLLTRDATGWVGSAALRGSLTYTTAGLRAADSLKYWSNVLFVSPNGDNATAIKNKMTSPWLTLQAACDAATSGDLIYVMAGTYSTPTNLWKDGLRWHFENVVIGGTITTEYASSNCVFKATSSGTVHVTGNLRADQLIRIDTAGVVFNAQGYRLGQVYLGGGAIGAKVNIRTIETPSALYVSANNADPLTDNVVNIYADKWVEIGSGTGHYPLMFVNNTGSTPKKNSYTIEVKTADVSSWGDLYPLRGIIQGRTVNHRFDSCTTTLKIGKGKFNHTSEWGMLGYYPYQAGTGNSLIVECDDCEFRGNTRLGARLNIQGNDLMKIKGKYTTYSKTYPLLTFEVGHASTGQRLIFDGDFIGIDTSLFNFNVAGNFELTGSFRNYESDDKIIDQTVANGSYKPILRDAYFRSPATTPIQSSTATTWYTAGAWDYATITEDADITFTRENEYGATTGGSGAANSILDSLGNGSILIDANTNDLEFEGLGTFRVTETGGNEIEVNGTEVSILGKMKAKQEGYYTITSTSSPQTLSNDYSDNLINQGGTQASFTFQFPASPADGQILTLTYNNAISALTLDGNGNTIVGSAVTTAVAGSQRKFKFYTGIGWIKIY